MFVAYPRPLMFQMPDRWGLASGVLGAGAVRFGLPSGVRGMPGVGSLSHCAVAPAAQRRTSRNDRAAGGPRARNLISQPLNRNNACEVMPQQPTFKPCVGCTVEII